MTSKDKTLSKNEELRIAFLIVHNAVELFICFENNFNEYKQFLTVVIGLINGVLRDWLFWSRSRPVEQKPVPVQIPAKPVPISFLRYGNDNNSSSQNENEYL
jgi:hypothetical protein